MSITYNCISAEFGRVAQFTIPDSQDTFNWCGVDYPTDNPPKRLNDPDNSNYAELVE